MRRFVILCICFLTFIMSLTGCTETTAAIDASAVLEEVLEEVQFAVPLSEVGENAALFFGMLPEGTEIRLFTGAGYYADELALITVSRETDRAAAMDCVERHIEELQFQHVNYHPEEVEKLDHAVIYQNADHIFLCVTADYVTAQQVFDRAADKHPLVLGETPDVTEEPMVSPEYNGGDVSPTPNAVSPELTPELTPEPTPTPVPEQTPAPTPTLFSGVINYASPNTVLAVDQGEYPELISQSGFYYDYGNNVIRVDNRAYEMFTYWDSIAQGYIQLVNSAAAQLEGETKVHSLLIPTAAGVVLPDDTARQLPYYTHQGEAIECVFSQLSDQVGKINCFYNLMKHREEYLYFRTDFHWNGLGAYYAYEAFCESVGEIPYTLEERRRVEFDGFLGAHYWNTTGCDPYIGNNPDTVVAYYPKSDSASMIYTDRNGMTYSWPIIADVTNWNSDTKYLAYAAADQPIAVFTNPEVTDGSVCIIVKDSFGNPMMSYMVDHYSTIYEIDYRYWDGNLIDLARQVGADDLIFMNCLTLICANYTIGCIAGIMD